MPNAFIDDGGYQTDAWWEGLTKRVEPARGFWIDPNQPRETVSWYEAMAYAGWLDARLRERGLVPEGSVVRLPTEEELESGPRQRRPRIPLGRIRLGARQYRRNVGQRRTPLFRANLRRRPLPSRRFPLRRAGYGRECLGMVP
jgi:formylglycine-generating enzyme required for sulfatase activity